MWKTLSIKTIFQNSISLSPARGGGFLTDRVHTPSKRPSQRSSEGGRAPPPTRSQPRASLRPPPTPRPRPPAPRASPDPTAPPPTPRASSEPQGHPRPPGLPRPPGPRPPPRGPPPTPGPLPTPGASPPGPAHLDLWKKLKEDTSYAALSSTALGSPLYRTLRLYSFMVPRPQAARPPAAPARREQRGRRPWGPPQAADGSDAGFPAWLGVHFRFRSGAAALAPTEGFSCPGCTKKQPETRRRWDGRGGEKSAAYARAYKPGPAPPACLGPPSPSCSVRTPPGPPRLRDLSPPSWGVPPSPGLTPLSLLGCPSPSGASPLSLLGCPVPFQAASSLLGCPESSQTQALPPS